MCTDQYRLPAMNSIGGCESDSARGTISVPFFSECILSVYQTLPNQEANPWICLGNVYGCKGNL